MKSRIAMFAAMSVFAMLISHSAHGQQASQDPQHEQHHSETAGAAVPADTRGNMMSMMAGMKTADAKLDALVKKMNVAKGQAKTDAIAELLTALVDNQRISHELMMTNMMSMMNMMSGDMMSGRGDRGRTAPVTPDK